VATGYAEVDDILAGLQPASLTIVGARPAMGKALALDTPVPTPGGWATMATLRVGDEVFDEHGQPCRVMYTSPVFHGHRCYRVQFDDGTEVVADAGHRWLAYDYPAWCTHRERVARLGGGERSARPLPCAGQSSHRPLPRVVTTEQMLAEGVRTPDSGRPNWYLPLAGAIEGRALALAVDPYVLGCWLGAGTATAELRFASGDAPHFVAELGQRGYGLTRGGTRRWVAVPVPPPAARQDDGGPWRDLARELEAAGLPADGAKFVPAPYLRTSAKERLARTARWSCA
jgi:replicative DNA helicase